VSLLTDLIVGYSLVGLAAWRMLAGAIAWEGHEEKSNPQPEWGIGIVAGGIAAVFWPVVLLVAALVVTETKWPFAVGPERNRRKHVQAQRVKELEKRNAELEREAGIGE
jgi:hypothetical protein